MITLTLDTNCIIDVAEERPSAVHVRGFLEAARTGTINLALVASSASERQQGVGSWIVPRILESGALRWDLVISICYLRLHG